MDIKKLKLSISQDQTYFLYRFTLCLSVQTSVWVISRDTVVLSLERLDLDWLVFAWLIRQH